MLVVLVLVFASSLTSSLASSCEDAEVFDDEDDMVVSVGVMDVRKLPTMIK